MNQDWDFSPPSQSELGDHDIIQAGQFLKHKRIALMLTASIAAYRAPDLIRDLRRQGADVIVYATKESLRYVGRTALEWTSLHPVIDELGADAEHLSGAKPIDAYLVAPATYSTINKTATGIADSVVTATLASALGKIEQGQARVLIAPCMHGSMHNRILIDSLKKLSELGVDVIRPRQENGKDNLPDNEILVSETIRSLADSPLKGRSVLVTGGPTPVPLDHIRRLTNHFTGALAIEIAKQLHFRGANCHLMLGAGSNLPPSYLNHYRINTFDQYLSTIHHLIQQHAIEWGVFSAAVADYRPENVFSGKMPSGERQKTLNLVPTIKVIQEVRHAYPDLNMVTFKYEEGLTHDELMEIARQRVVCGYQLVVANRGEERGPQGEQVAWLVESAADPIRLEGKPQIAEGIVRRIAQWY